MPLQEARATAHQTAGAGEAVAEAEVAAEEVAEAEHRVWVTRGSREAAHAIQGTRRHLCRQTHWVKYAVACSSRRRRHFSLFRVWVAPIGASVLAPLSFLPLPSQQAHGIVLGSRAPSTLFLSGLRER